MIPRAALIAATSSPDTIWDACVVSHSRTAASSRGAEAAVLISADEFASWQETREIQRNPTFMREIKRGLRQLEKGQQFTFEEVFGEPLMNCKSRK